MLVHKRKREITVYEVVSDFRATGPTRGLMDPVLGSCGEVLQARQPGDPAPPDPNDQPLVTPADLVRIRRLQIANTAAQLLKKHKGQARRKARDKALALSRSPRQQLLWSYDPTDWMIRRGQHFVGVYTWTVGDFTDTRCPHQHRTAYAAIWCDDFPDDQPPLHVVIVSNATKRVVRSLKKSQSEG